MLPPLQLRDVALGGLKTSLIQAQLAFPSLAALFGALPAVRQPPQDPPGDPATELRKLLASQQAHLLGGLAPPAAAGPPPLPHLELAPHHPHLLLTRAPPAGRPGGGGRSTARPSGSTLTGERSCEPDTVVTGFTGFTGYGGGKEWSSDGSQGQSRKRARRAAPDADRACANCGTTSTPFWRKDRVTGAPNW